MWFIFVFPQHLAHSRCLPSLYIHNLVCVCVCWGVPSCVLNFRGQPGAQYVLASVLTARNTTQPPPSRQECHLCTRFPSLNN